MKMRLPVSMGIVYVTTCHLALMLQAYVVLKIVCGSYLHKRKTILNHVFEFKNVTLTPQINSSFIFLAIYNICRYHDMNGEILKDIIMIIIISPNEVFGDIMVLASPPRPPVDPDDVNILTGKIFNGSLSKFISG